MSKRRFNTSGEKPVYTNPDALCSNSMLTLVWKLIGYSLKTQGKDANGRTMRWDITFQECGDVIEYLIAIRQGHSLDGEIWNISADGKRLLKEYANELIAQFPQLKPTPKDDGVKTVVAPVAPVAIKPVFNSAPVTVAKVLRKKRQHVKPTGPIPIGK